MRPAALASAVPCCRPAPSRPAAAPVRVLASSSGLDAQRGGPASTSHPHILQPSRAPRGAQNNIVELREYRRGVGLCVVNRDGLVFAARRVDDTENTWQMPQGGIDRLENPMTAALRELREETGMTSARIVASIDPWLHYDFPTKVRAQLHGGWVRYRGQTQKWFLVEFCGCESEIDISCAHGHGEREFSEFTWMPLEALPGAVVGFKREVYQRVAHHFGPLIQRRFGPAARSGGSCVRQTA